MLPKPSPPATDVVSERKSTPIQSEPSQDPTTDDSVLEDNERWTELRFTWTGKTFTLRIADSDRVYDLKIELQKLTRVPPGRQKILGLVKGKLPADEARVADLGLPTGKQFTLIGTPEGEEIEDPSKLESDLVGDVDVDLSENPAAAAKYKNDQRNIRAIRDATKNLQVTLIHPLRPGKRLLVLDIDYTILDTKPLTSGSLPPAECARPGLHEFLTAVYPYYDICIWSQTSWIWLETKLVELGMLGPSVDRNYEISFVLDKTCMFTVFSERHNKSQMHSVKALQIIWNHLPQFDAKNTIHVDDLTRNFALNPGEGLRIRAFRNAHTAEAQADRELNKLAQYLVHVSRVDDFTTIKHKKWKDVVRSLPSP